MLLKIFFMTIIYMFKNKDVKIFLISAVLYRKPVCDYLE